ncbi:MAG TPA: hypothetical protein DCL21_05715 [Alphaproteobacteria bacterium]|nr:hypothetical protein [Alphaproteobacteria bacterium]
MEYVDSLVKQGESMSEGTKILIGALITIILGVSSLLGSWAFFSLLSLPEKYVLKSDYRADISEIKDTIKDNTSELKGSLKTIQSDIKKLLQEKK